MAEIKIEKKRTVWPWVLLALVIIALLIYFLAVPDKDDDYEQVTERTVVESTNESDMLGVNEENPTVMAYVEWLDTNLGRMGIDHEFTHEAITELANAIKALASDIDYNVDAELDQAKEYADQIRQEPYETSHANKIRNATDMLSQALVNMQQARYPGLQEDARAVKNASQQIKPDELTLDQKEEVKGFFRKATDLLQEMN